MPRLSELASRGAHLPFTNSFPCVTWPSQTHIITGKLPNAHGVVANGFFRRDQRQVEMWTAGNEAIQSPQIWDVLRQRRPGTTSAVWFPMLSKRCGADYVCMPAPIHNPDGSEDLWCYTKPTELYGELRDRWGHFPLQHFWGPLANMKSTDWIVDSAVYAAGRFQPDYFFLYLPHLDYAAQKFGPDSAEAVRSLGELDVAIGRLIDGFQEAYANNLTWLAATEYVITAVDLVTYPNRLLREAGLLAVRDEEGSEHLDLANSRAWAMVDHQFSHVFVQNGDKAVMKSVQQLFSTANGFAEVLAAEQRAKYGLDHERAGEVVLVSEPNSWQAYYWWLDDNNAPSFARTVDIHRKPGYDPVELCFDLATKNTPLDATLIRGSHGAPVPSEQPRGVLVSSDASLSGQTPIRDVDLFNMVLKQFAAE